MVALPSLTEAGRVHEVVEEAKRVFAQEAIFIRYGAHSEVL